MTAPRPTPSAGRVWLVGAGPGDPGLITARGLALLRAADAVVYDRLAAPALLDEARSDAELYDVGKAPRGRAARQEDINALLVRLGREGKRVVRLKGGDPFVFGRGGEEALSLVEAGVAWEVVPGVTAAIAAPAYAGIPVTHRGLAGSFTVVTGHVGLREPGVARADTLVVLMAVEQLALVVADLVEQGRSLDTPAALVHAASTARQRTVHATLGTLAEAARQHGVTAPATLVVGPTAQLGEQLGWFETRPLFGRRILVARTRPEPGQLAELLRDAGAVTLELPTHQVAPLADTSALDAALIELAKGAFNWVVFGGPPIVSAVWDRLAALGLDSRAVRARVGAYGATTTEALHAHGIAPDWRTAAYRAETVTADFATQNLDGQRVLLPSLESSAALSQGLETRGAQVQVIEVAQVTEDAEQDRQRLDDWLGSGRLDLVVFPASRSVESMKHLLAERLEADPVRVLVAGPTTAAAARAAGLRVDGVADDPSHQGMLAAATRLLAAQASQPTIRDEKGER